MNKKLQSQISQIFEKQKQFFAFQEETRIMIEKMKSLPKQLETIQENQSKFAEEHQTILTTAKNINQMNQNTIDEGQQMKTALDFLSIAYKDIIDNKWRGVTIS